MACQVCHKPYYVSTSTDGVDFDTKPHVCHTCGKSFSLKIQLKRHILTHAGAAPYTCISCEKNADAIESVSKSEKLKYICDICDEKFSAKRLLNIHYLSHSDPDVLHCETCNESFATVSLLKKHSLIHKSVSGKTNKKNKSSSSPDILHECSICFKTFLQKKSFEKHFATHKPLTCPVCSRSFTVKADLKQHRSSGKCKAKSKKRKVDDDSDDEDFVVDTPTDRPTRKHSCGICGKTFSRKSALDGHYAVHQADVSDFSDKGSDSDCELIVSEVEVKPKEEKPKEDKPKEEKPKIFRCDLCDKQFKSKIKHRKHSLCHVNEIFGISSKSVTNSDGAKVEKIVLRRKKKEKKFSCEKCRKKFVGETCLKKHIEKHEKMDIIKKEKREERRHKQRESAKKVYICEFCGEDFTGKKALFLKHRISHTPEVCGICDERFVNREGLREHCKIHIGTEEGRRFLECSQKAFDVKKGIVSPEPKVEYIYLVLR